MKKSLTDSIEKRILFEDNHLIAINKNWGELAQGDKSGDESLVDTLKSYLKEKYQKPGNVFCGLIHRLDRPVSGVILFAKTSKALARMNNAFKEREVKKIYWALVTNKVEKEVENLEHWLKKDPVKNKTRAYDYEVKNSKKALLSYEGLVSKNQFTLLQVEPHTGRSHQIRSQVSYAISPIYNDVKYGSKTDLPLGRIYLHSKQLSFKHPVSKVNITIEAPLPKDPIWDLFS